MIMTGKCGKASGGNTLYGTSSCIILWVDGLQPFTDSGNGSMYDEDKDCLGMIMILGAQRDLSMTQNP